MFIFVMDQWLKSLLDYLVHSDFASNHELRLKLPYTQQLVNKAKGLDSLV